MTQVVVGGENFSSIILLVNMAQLTQAQVNEMNTSDLKKLKQSNKEDLLAYISLLRGKVEELQSYQLISTRVSLLERSHVNSLQYNRRESVEISGVPEAVSDGNLETYCLDVLEEIGCGEIDKMDVHACHRLKNRKNTIIRFVNRKHANLALHNKKKLKSIDRTKYKLPTESKGLFINESLCRPMQFLAFKVRKAFSAKKINSWNLWKGKLSLKINEKTSVISHIDDLIELNLATEEDRSSFFR